MEVKNDIDNKLLGRKELKVFFKEGAARDRQNIKQEVAKKLKAKENLVVVNNMEAHFGSRDLMAEVFVYEKEDTLKKLTLSHIAKRNEAPAKEETEEAAPAAEAAAPTVEETPAEAPAEEKKDAAAEAASEESEENAEETKKEEE